VKTPKSFAAALSQTRLPSVFNPYCDCCPVHDRPGAARVRKRNLVRCFEAALASRIAFSGYGSVRKIRTFPNPRLGSEVRNPLARFK
jgi:hypothetical protein